MKIEFEDLKQDEVLALIAWFAKKVGNDFVIHAGDTDVQVTLKKAKRAGADDDMDAIAAFCGCAAAAGLTACL